jgi:hypothetical protein
MWRDWSRRVRSSIRLQSTGISSAFGVADRVSPRTIQPNCWSGGKAINAHKYNEILICSLFSFSGSRYDYQDGQEGYDPFPNRCHPS